MECTFAILTKVAENKFCVTIEIPSGPFKGRIVDKVEYEDIYRLCNIDIYECHIILL
jgi:hypothetical protein